MVTEFLCCDPLSVNMTIGH